MTDTWTCFAAFLIGLAFLGAALAVALRSHRASGQTIAAERKALFKTIRRARRGTEIALCFVWAVCFLLRTGGLWTGVAALFTAVGGGIAAVCGVQWVEIVNVVRGMLQDYYEHQRLKQAN